MDDHAHRQAYRAFLRSRWAPRSRVLAIYAGLGSLVFFVFDALLASSQQAPPSLLQIAVRRLPWALLPLAGGLAAVRAPGWRWLPGLVVTFSIAYTWANDWSYFALGQAGSPIQVLTLVTCVITAATFLPLALLERVGVLALQVLGHFGLGWIFPEGRPLGERLWTELAALCLMVCVTVVFENFAAEQRRSLQLRRELERTLALVEESRRHTAEAAAELRKLAALVSHEVSNPLAAVKGNVSYLRDAIDSAERRQVVEETLAAVDRIERLLDELREK